MPLQIVQVAGALKSFSKLWSAQGLLWTGFVVAVLFMAAAGIAMTASTKVYLSAAAADELVDLKRGTAGETVGTDGKVLFTPALNGGSIGVVFLSIAAVLLAVIAGIGFYATRAVSAAL